MTSRTDQRPEPPRTTQTRNRDLPDAGSLALVKNAASSYFSAVDLDAGETVARLGDGRYPHTALFHPDGRHAYLLYIASAHLEAVDLRTLETVATVEDLGTMSVGSALAPDGDLLFVGTGVALPDAETPGVLAFDVRDGAAPRRVGVRELSRCSGMGVGPDGRLYVALKERSEVAALSADADLAVEDRYPVGTEPHDLYPVPGADLVAVNNAGESFASFVDVERGGVTHVETGANPHGVAFAPERRLAVVPARGDDRVALVDLDAVERGDPATEALVDLGTTTGFAAVGPDERYAVVDAYDASHVTVVDLSSQSVAARVEVGGEPLHVVFAPDGRECYVGNMARADLAVLDTAPLLDGRPGDVTVARRITGLGEKPSGIFRPEVRA